MKGTFLDIWCAKSLKYSTSNASVLGDITKLKYESLSFCSC